MPQDQDIPAFGQSSMLEPEFEPHYNAWKADPNPKNTSALLGALNPVIDSAMRTYGGRNPSPTLKSKAKLMTIQGLPRYDPSRAKLRTHLMSHLQGLRRASAQESQIISIPERVGLDLYRLRTAENDLQDKLGREPSSAELADHMGVSMKRIGYIRKAQPGLSEGMISQTGEAGEEQASSGPAVQQADGQKLWSEYIFHDLHPTDQVILEYSQGLHGRPMLSKQQIAKKLRLSPGAVSQRAARIQSLLDKEEELGRGMF